MDSWIAAGFQPVSLNNAAEIEQIRPQFADIEFIRTGRDAGAICGKPLVFVDDIFAAVCAAGDGVSGIVNSDIIFGGSHDLPKLFDARATGGLVFGSRMDIDQPGDIVGDIFRAGYDFFFMDADTARVYPPTQLSMGAPMWDYWAALVPILRGRKCSLMNSVCAYHVRHEQNWDNALNIRMMKEILDYADMEFEGVDGVDFNSENKASKSVLRQFGHFIVPFLETQSKRVF